MADKGAVVVDKGVVVVEKGAVVVENGRWWLKRGGGLMTVTLSHRGVTCTSVTLRILTLSSSDLGGADF